MVTCTCTYYIGHIWQSTGHPLLVLLALLTSYTNNSSLISSYEMLVSYKPHHMILFHFFLSGHCSSQIIILDNVGGYLVELQTMNPATPDLTFVTTGLRNLEKQIQTLMKNW